ncbi:MAG: hypothetical protein R2762_28920 [Bryobacteraceae bacterium]
MQPYDWNLDESAWAPKPEPWTEEEIYVISDRAWMLYRQGAYQQAAVLARGLAAIDPANGYARKTLALSLTGLGLDQEAWECWCGLAESDPFDLDAVAGRCEAAIQLGRFEEAARDLARLQADAPWRSSGLRFRLETATSPKPSR